MVDKRESEVEKKIRLYALATGWFVSKIVGTRGIMDRVFIKNGVTIWAEIKRDGKEPSLQQIKRRIEMEKHGAICFVWDNFNEAKKTLDVYTEI